MHRHGKRAALLLVALTMLLGSAAPPAPVTAAQGATPMADCRATTPGENLAIIRSFFEEGMNGADLSVIDRVTAPDVVYHGATVADESGLDAVKRIYGEALTGFPDIQYTLLTSVADGDAVALRYRVEGVHTGDFRGLAPTGNAITWNHSTFAHVACGRISEMWAEIDQLDRLREFGILQQCPPRAPAALRKARRRLSPSSIGCAPRSTSRGISTSCPRSLPRDISMGRRTDRTPSESPKGRDGSGVS
jgi:predicted ester cyclase